MRHRKPVRLEWGQSPPIGWEIDRVKAMFLDDTVTISAEQLADLEVDHYSIPSYDETGGPLRENGSSIASSKTILCGGEILFSKLNTHKPRVCIVPEDNNLKIASTEFIALREWHKGSLNKKFFRHMLSSVGFVNYISCFQTSVTNSHKRVSPRNLWQTHVPTPPSVEQNRIAAFLDASCLQIEHAIAGKQSQMETLKALQRATVQRAVTNGLDPDVLVRQTGNAWIESVPAHWDLVCLKRISEIQTGLTLGKVYEGPVIERPYLRVANVQDGHLDLQEVTTIEVPPEVAIRVQLRTNDVLMTEGGDLDKLGRGYLWGGQIEGCLHQNHIFAVRCFPHKLVPKFLTYLTSSQYGRNYFEATGKRTTNLASTNSTKVGLFPIPLPPVPEQERLVELLEDRLQRIAQIGDRISDQISTLLAYRKALIHECVTGQRRITEEDLNRVLKNG